MLGSTIPHQLNASSEATRAVPCHEELFPASDTPALLHLSIRSKHAWDSLPSTAAHWLSVAPKTTYSEPIHGRESGKGCRRRRPRNWRDLAAEDGRLVGNQLEAGLETRRDTTLRSPRSMNPAASRSWLAWRRKRWDLLAGALQCPSFRTDANVGSYGDWLQDQRQSKGAGVQPSHRLLIPQDTPGLGQNRKDRSLAVPTSTPTSRLLP